MTEPDDEQRPLTEEELRAFEDGTQYYSNLTGMLGGRLVAEVRSLRAEVARLEAVRKEALGTTGCIEEQIRGLKRQRNEARAEADRANTEAREFQARLQRAVDGSLSRKHRAEAAEAKRDHFRKVIEGALRQSSRFGTDQLESPVVRAMLEALHAALRAEVGQGGAGLAADSEDFFEIDGRRILTFRPDGTFAVSTPLSPVDAAMALRSLAEAYSQLSKEARG